MNGAPAPWRPATVADDEAAAAVDRILVLIEGRGNREQIVHQLGQRYHLLSPHAGDLPGDGFDLVIADGPGLRRWHDPVVQARAAQQPVFLPVMLILPRAELRGQGSDPNGIVDDFVITPIDLTEFLERIGMLLRARAQALRQREELIRLVNFDQTTGLPNRHLFTDRVDTALRGARQRGLGLYVLAIHIPLAGLQESVGEYALEEAAAICSRRLGAAVGEGAGLARLGRQDWGARCPSGTTLQQVLELCGAIEAIAAEPVQVAGESLRIRPRMGAAEWPQDAGSGAELIDAAMAASQRASPGSPAFYAVEQRDAALHYLRTEAQLQEALAAGKFELWLQPKLALQGEGPPTAEALLRWRLPSGELVPPGQFIPVAESSGLIHDITHWVIETALCTIGQCQRECGRTLHIAVNVTPADVQPVRFGEWLQELCHEHGVAPDVLELELTETMVCDMDEETVDRLRALRAAGFGIAIDDFGTGYSSLGYLHQLPARTLKIDKCFIDGLPDASSGTTITRAVINLAREFDLELVAEGIEHSSQLEYLRAAGVEYGQGYYIARPMPMADYWQWLQQRI